MTATAEALIRVFAATVAGLDPAAATERALRRPHIAEALVGRPLWLAAVGKASRRMADGALAALGDRVRGGLVVTQAGRTVPPPLVAIAGDHPVPGTSSLMAGRALLAMSRAIPASHALLALVSGGASAMAEVPATGVSLEDVVARVRAAVLAGQPIASVNRLRAELSAIKGGRLAGACQAPVVTIVISDVVGDDPAIVGSGPTVGPAAERRAHDRVAVAAGMTDLGPEAERAVRHVLGASARLVNATVGCSVTELALEVAGTIERAIRAAEDGPVVLIWAGEPTLALPGTVGRGGRARHLALSVARHLAGRSGWTLLVAGTDGVDGTDDAAGAVIDGTTTSRIAASGGNVDAALAAYDSGSALAAIDGAVIVGPTGVNHADLVVAYVAPSVL